MRVADFFRRDTEELAGWLRLKLVARGSHLANIDRWPTREDFLTSNASRAMSTEVCIHIANLLYLASYLCRDILYLRGLTCAGLGFGIVFFCSRTQAMFTPAAWMGVFLVVNLVQIGRILRERWARRLSPEQAEVKRLLLERLSAPNCSMCLRSRFATATGAVLLECSAEIELGEEEELLRDLALERLSDEELMHLIIRRFWPSLERLSRAWLRSAVRPRRATMAVEFPTIFLPVEKNHRQESLCHDGRKLYATIAE